LDGLPLALATAGAYLDQVAISLLDYLRLYKESWTQLQESSPQLSSYEDRTLYSTGQISFNYIKKQNSLSAKLLCFWAYFDSQDLWLELLQHSDSTDPDWVQQLARDELSFHQVVRVLSDHGLVEVDMSLQELIESRGYSVHRCVHSWTIHVLNQEWDYDLARIAMKFVGSHAPRKEAIHPWLTQRRLLQHAARCSTMLSNGLLRDDHIAWECYKLGDLYADQDKLVLANQMYGRALEGYEKAFGTEHMSTLDIVNNLGSLYKNQGKFALAEQMYERALEGYERELGAEHTSTLDIVNNLGSLYKNQGKFALAGQMYERALQGYEKALSAEHTSTLGIVNNLGNLYKNQGKLALAERMYERALQGNEKALGVEHRSTLRTVNNFGSLYADQGKLALAEQMYERALQGYEKALGADNSTTYIPSLNTVKNLGSLFQSQGDFVKTKIMYSKALAGYEKVVGPDHLRCQELQEILQDLNIMAEQEAMKGREEPLNRYGEEASRLDTERGPSKLHKLFGKLGLK
jgi:tetratricopeptide (TPR) repeat protein